jgi:hypothetical protein
MSDWKSFAELAAEYLNPETGRTYPGKFEGESLLAPYFYKASLDGTADELASMEDGCGEYVALIEVTEDDRQFFAGTSLAIDVGDSFALITEADSGFVGCELMTSSAAEILRRKYENASEDGQEESDE